MNSLSEFSGVVENFLLSGGDEDELDDVTEIPEERYFDPVFALEADWETSTYIHTTL